MCHWCGHETFAGHRNRRRRTRAPVAVAGLFPKPANSPELPTKHDRPPAAAPPTVRGSRESALPRGATQKPIALPASRANGLATSARARTLRPPTVRSLGRSANSATASRARWPSARALTAASGDKVSISNPPQRFTSSTDQFDDRVGLMILQSGKIGLFPDRNHHELSHQRFVLVVAGQKVFDDRMEFGF